GHQIGIVHGENVELANWGFPDPKDPLADQDATALHGRKRAAPGAGYLYGRGPHIASIVLRGVVGMELQAYVDQKLATPMGWGRWGWAARRPTGTLPHTPGEAGIPLHSPDGP